MRIDKFSYTFGKKNGGGSTPSSGYVEDGAVAIHENRQFNTADLDQRITGTLGLPSIDTDNNGFTMEARVCATLSPDNYSAFFDIEGSSNRALLGVTTTAAEKDDSSDFGIDVWGWGTEFVFKPENMMYGDWHTFSFVIDSTDAKLYIDGQLFGTQSAAAASISPQGIYQMYYKYTSRYQKGKWGCTRWYNKALTAAEIAENYAIDAQRYHNAP